MYYKAVNGEKKIVDVYTDEELARSYVKMDLASNIPVRCSGQDDPFGILASDASVIFSIGEQTGDYELVTLKGFEGRGEYDTIKAAIEEQRRIDDEEEEEDQDDSELPDRVPSRAELNETIIAQQDAIDMLTECLLEMSEIVYGE